ncbi:daunorubicin resistance protein DrrA family ABC transporter ATP-binding protein [Actinoplanes ianthinogenes]|uniref:Daunorubicin resistance protein DrrA family ABC transporter ATP-binding protein n=1 Tax=Actinoplanes ianthinogenes TaxID=122358 RepID=A0ABM7LXR9_9ACTN|nr:ABC transporter ATP-binding protein [Actinoplanes ianthinogenes]BCJ44143.1 daunorubicin resistance protein DrrA family ABC transporter ATP-binding protein [Actinoplanes ianthinogenes]GGQ96063.1 daunorubicin resistance protein DrrA family ABC transporter ATP-binding protein [Actinoplanes ianthinogenes]
MTAAFDIDTLRVTYGEVVAVDGISLRSAPGRITALLGPNGAGKSSLLQALSTALTPAAGSITIFGHDVRQQPALARRRLGLVFQERTLDQDLSVWQNLWFHARLFGLSRPDARQAITRLLEQFGLAHRAGDPVSALSGGLSRRVEIIRALVHQPSLLILDEPTTALDPQARRQVWDDLRRLRAEAGTTILYSTHYLDEAEYADDVVIVDGGTVVEQGSPAVLKAGLGSSRVLLSTGDDTLALTTLTAAGFDAVPHGGGIAVPCAEPERRIAAIIAALTVPVLSVSVQHPSLDDVFLALSAAGAEVRL